MTECIEMEIKRDMMVWQRNGVSVALVLCMIVFSLIGSHGKPLEVDEKEVKLIKFRTCNKIFSSNATLTVFRPKFII